MDSLPPRPPGDEVLRLMSCAARAAGAAILKVYRQADYGVVTKQDDSPLTHADLAAHRAIAEVLDGALGGLPLLSEEGVPQPWAQRRQWRRYWLVDPLDGTRDFIARTDQFSVNIALVENGIAVLGAVLAPVQDELYLGQRDSPDPAQWRAWKSVAGGAPEAIHVRSLTEISDDKPLTLVASRRHSVARTARLIKLLGNDFGPVTRRDLGSSLKMCLIAEGQADIYPRYGPTGEWDTAAAQAVLEAAGGCLCGLDGLPRRYNCKESLINPAFFAAGDCSVEWAELLTLVASEQIVG
ncbi:MAG: 3'(2'),5'-bisphosphate nucleotidase CysQ [Porticoccaceae bacterium]|nr:3'(2'),5'-bisphosphate nucleotidase CysQ [Porticoccaceae bacterium]